MPPTKSSLTTKKGAISPIQTTFNTTGGNPFGHFFRTLVSDVVNFVTATPKNINGTKAVAVVRGTGQGIVNGTQTQKTPVNVKKHTTNTDPNSKNTVVPANNTPTNIKFNLAPHNWSLPINQNLMNVSSTYQDQSMRRARMWCYVGADSSSYTDLTGIGSSSQTGVVTGGTGVASTLDTQWGFQFLWNPTQISTSVQRNANLVPQAMDAFIGRGVPLFPGTEAISFVAVINRVNDFACFKAFKLNTGPLPGNLDDSTLDTAVYNYYSRSAGAVQSLNQLINELMNRGTMADIEYIFKMVNGDGILAAGWRNALGRKTADINFLAPTPVAVQFGPNADSLSYVGWIESISVSHQMFTEDMIPIHSEVTINMSAYSQSSLK